MSIFLDLNSLLHATAFKMEIILIYIYTCDCGFLKFILNTKMKTFCKSYHRLHCIHFISMKLSCQNLKLPPDGTCFAHANIFIWDFSIVGAWDKSHQTSLLFQLMWQWWSFYFSLLLWSKPKGCQLRTEKCSSTRIENIMITIHSRFVC